MAIVDKDKVLVVKYPYVLKKDALKQKHDELLAQINSGCVVLDGSAEIMLVSKDDIVMANEKKDRIPLYYL